MNKKKLIEMLKRLEEEIVQYVPDGTQLNSTYLNDIIEYKEISTNLLVDMEMCESIQIKDLDTLHKLYAKYVKEERSDC